MSKIISFSMDDIEYQTVFSDVNTRKSAFIRDLIRKGLELHTGDYENYKLKNINLLKELYTRQDQIRKLTAEVEKLRRLLNKQKDLQANLFSETDLSEFKTEIEENQELKKFFNDAVTVLDMDNRFFQNLYTSFKDKFGYTEILSQEFHKYIMMYREIKRNGGDKK